MPGKKSPGAGKYAAGRLSAIPESLKNSDEFLSGGAGITDNEFYYEKDAKLSFVRQIPPEKIKEFECDSDISVVLSRYFKCLEEGINYPFLGIFSEGSQLMRLEYPHSESFYKARWGRLPPGLSVQNQIQR